MSYSKSKFQLTHLLQQAWYRMGQMKTWVITGGSTTTTVNTAWAGVDDAIFEDDDPTLIYGSIVVVEDAALTGAAPEGEIARITDYDSASTTITHDAVSTAVASGDRVATISALFPYEDMKELANIAIRKLGKIDVIDTSLTVVAGQTEYVMPIRQAPKRVRIQRLNASSDNRWQLIQGWSVIPAVVGTGWKLVVPPLVQGFSIELLYEDLHPKLNSYEDDIMEIVHPELAVNALVAEAYQWYNNQINGSNSYFLQRENKALQDLEQAKVNYPIYKLDEQVQGLPHWGRQSEYVPKTSDLRY
jgi:hypothetical protein